MTNYTELILIAESCFDDIDYNISILSNASAMLNEYLEQINWVGFYLFVNNKLILGPFQGKQACLEIPIGKGVCGTVAKNLKTELVGNVHDFKGHIACDSRSNSEIVIPIFLESKFYGVLDIDSEQFNRFSKVDQTELEKFVSILEKKLNC